MIQRDVGVHILQIPVDVAVSERRRRRSAQKGQTKRERRNVGNVGEKSVKWRGSGAARKLGAPIKIDLGGWRGDEGCVVSFAKGDFSNREGVG